MSETKKRVSTAVALSNYPEITANTNYFIHGVTISIVAEAGESLTDEPIWVMKVDKSANENIFTAVFKTLKAANEFKNRITITRSGITISTI